MTKLVQYKGDRISYKGCTSPSLLVVGKIYEVNEEIDLGYQTNYILKEVDGEFNSVWFKKVELPVAMALAKEMPNLGKPMKNLLRFTKNEVRQILQTTPVRNIEKIERNVFKVLTQNTIYIIQVVSD